MGSAFVIGAGHIQCRKGRAGTWGNHWPGGTISGERGRGGVWCPW